eukprot:4280946-Prymnesium_polylepis.1
MEAHRDMVLQTIGVPGGMPDLLAVPDDFKATIVVAKHCVEAEDSKFLHSLSYIFGHADSSEDMLEDADGSGLSFLDIVRTRGKNASPRDIALVAASFAKTVQMG